MRPELLFLDLMKKTLSFTLWDEPEVPLELFIYRCSLPKRIVYRLFSYALRLFDLQAVKQSNFEDKSRREGMVWPRYAETMIGLKRLDNVQFCVESIIQNDIEGDLIETGVWRGGATIFMRAVLAAYGIKDRCVFVADSFEGLPVPDETRYPQDKGDRNYTQSFLKVSKEEVEANFKKYGLLDDQVIFLKGWFKDALPNAPIEKLSILRLDGDMYESTMDALVNLYPKLSKGGFCIIDDYEIPSCKKAVDDYRSRWNIDIPLVKIDWTGVFWQKE
ncbi:TylF/MycF family methyltransferase [Thermodesulfobacteriota bacterium]